MATMQTQCPQCYGSGYICQYQEDGNKPNMMTQVVTVCPNCGGEGVIFASRPTVMTFEEAVGKLMRQSVKCPHCGGEVPI